MKKRISPVLLLMIALFIFSSCDKLNLKKDIDLSSDTAKISYAIGQQIGKGIKMQNLEVDTKVMASSIQDALDGKESKLSNEEIRSTMMSMRQKMMAAKAKEAALNEEKGKKFLADNKKKEGIVELPSGLQYKIIKAGKGEMPKIDSRVKVHYKGVLIDGTEFDSSYKRNKPAEFMVTGVIKGWTEALQLMKKGAHWKLFIPANLAYGSRPRPKIPGNSTLIFDVELLDIIKVDHKAAKTKKKPRIITIPPKPKK